MFLEDENVPLVLGGLSQKHKQTRGCVKIRGLNLELLKNVNSIPPPHPIPGHLSRQP
jgi:hypothetical protein